MKVIYSLLLYSYSTLILASGEIWLQETNCMVIGSNAFELHSKQGSLSDYICSKNGKSITCSNTSSGATMSGGKPSALTSYTVILEDQEFAIWDADSHSGIIILLLKHKRYSAASTHIRSEGLITKHCVGEVKSHY